MVQNGTILELSAKQKEAALLVAQDRLTDERIASTLNIVRTTLNRWKQDPQFQCLVAEHSEQIRQAVMTQGIADRVNRLNRLDRDWKRLQELIDLRAEKTPDDAIGGSTGMIVRKETPGKYGTVIEYAADTAVLAELRAMEQQAAKELGQWTEKTEATVHDSSAVDALKRKLAGLAPIGGAREVPGEPDA